MKQLDKSSFHTLAKLRFQGSIDGDQRLKNLAPSYWVYETLLESLHQTGWHRFSAGFKSGIYGHPVKPWVLKLMGMGIGDDPLYFAERGYYLDHERNMTAAFRSRGFDFAPKVMNQDDSIAFLMAEGGVREEDAVRRCRNNDLLVIERIEGIPFATQTGHFLNYEPDIAVFDSSLLREAQFALYNLRTRLLEANRAGLLHNDPMPANIIFSVRDDDSMIARLVDFELAQDLNASSPQYVNDSVRELYAHRDVPRNSQTGVHIKNLDQHVIDQAVSAFNELRASVRDLEGDVSEFDWLSVSISFIGGISINIGKAIKYWQDKLQHRETRVRPHHAAGAS